MDNLDILFFAIVTVFIAARLWSVLGQRNDDEPKRSNPFSTPMTTKEDGQDVMVVPDKERGNELAALTNSGHAPTSLAGILDQIKLQDPQFDEKAFLDGAKKAFASILESFVQGDLSPVAKWIGPSVQASFQAAIDDRSRSGHKLESKIHRFAHVEIDSARIEASKAFLTVTFVSYQTNVTLNQSGQTLSGDPHHEVEIRDIWVFSRDLKSQDPNWLLVETRS